MHVVFRRSWIQSPVTATEKLYLITHIYMPSYTHVSTYQYLNTWCAHTYFYNLAAVIMNTQVAERVQRASSTGGSS